MPLLSVKPRELNQMDEGLGILFIFGLVIAAIIAVVGFTFSALVYIFGHPILFGIGLMGIGAISSVIYAERRGGWSMPSTVSSVRFGSFQTSIRNWALGSTTALVCALVAYGSLAF